MNRKCPNARLVRAMMTSTNDGIVPDLMAGDFRSNDAGRAKTADFAVRKAKKRGDKIFSVVDALMIKFKEICPIR